MTDMQAFISIMMCVIGTAITRFLPFVIFPENKETPEIIATVFIIVVHRIKKNVLLSIAGGTLLYMALVQYIFI